MERAATLGERLLARLKTMDSPLVRDVRGRGLLIGVEIDTQRVSARTLCRRLADRGSSPRIPTTARAVIRFAPPLTIGLEQLDEGAAVFAMTIDEMTFGPAPR